MRLLTYNALVKQGFNVDHGRIINPTAFFIMIDKNYDSFALADKGNEEELLKWCSYMLRGLKRKSEYDY